MIDFTNKTYNSLIEALLKQGFSFQSFLEFISAPKKRIIILRHDVDSLPGNSLQFARIQADNGIKGTYYFRIVQGIFNEKIIKEIYSLGHEVGYHYEDVSLAAERQKIKVKRQKYKNKKFSDLQDCKTARPQDNGHIEEELALIAIESFKENLTKLRELVTVKTICMHGSPMSRWDSRLLWKYYDYRDFGIIGEPYFDVNFDEVLYLTDTGRRWDGDSMNVRDKATGDRRRATGEEKKGRGGEVGSKKYEVGSKEFEDSIKFNSENHPAHRAPHTAHRTPFPRFHSTFDIIKAAEEGRLPDKIMMTFHPQRWTDKPGPWVRELVWQNVKNVGKYLLIRMRD